MKLANNRSQSVLTLHSYGEFQPGRQTMAVGVQALRVLLVEDEFLVCDMMTEALTQHGFQVHAAMNANDALKHLTCGAPCDILLTDLNLGTGLDGVTLSR